MGEEKLFVNKVSSLDHEAWRLVLLVLRKQICIDLVDDLKTVYSIIPPHSLSWVLDCHHHRLQVLSIHTSEPAFCPNIKYKLRLYEGLILFSLTAILYNIPKLVLLLQSKPYNGVHPQLTPSYISSYSRPQTH